MRKRLELMHKLLSDKGSIHVHLDSNMVFHVKVMMDDIFGMQNFKGMITRKKCKPKNFTRKTYGNVSDYILFYSKTDNPVWNRPYEEWNDEKILKEYPYIEEDTGRRYKRQFAPEKLDELAAKGEIYWSSNGNPRRKVYLDQSNGIPVQDIWLDYLDANNQNTLITGYPTEKNLDMLKRIIETSSLKGDFVMDCFAGSGTTLVAAEELGRQWIGIDIGEETIATVVNRFKNGSKPMGDYVKKKVEQQTMTISLFVEDNNVLGEQCESKRNHSSVSFDILEEA